MTAHVTTSAYLDNHALVAFSCNRRGFCPSCDTRRMNESAAYLVDDIIPRVPVRQRALSFPVPLRRLLAAHPELCASAQTWCQEKGIIGLVECHPCSWLLHSRFLVGPFHCLPLLIAGSDCQSTIRNFLK
jgi:hypothetical protein